MVTTDPTQRVTDADFRRMIDSVVDVAILMLDPAGNILSWNEGARRIKGYDFDEVIGDAITLFYPPDEINADLLGRELTQALTSGRYECEGWRLRKDGSRFWANVVLAPIRDELGAHLGYVKLVRDLTEKRNLELRLSAYALMVESAPNAMILVNKAGRITLVNAQTEVLFGYTRQELLEQPIELLVPPNIRASHPQLRASFHADPQARPMGLGRELFGVTKDGREVPVEIGLSPLETPEGTFVLASIIDISERKQKLASEYARSLIEASLDPLVTISPAGKITDVNAATVKVTGVERDNLIGTDFSDYFTEPEKARQGYQQGFSKGFITDYPLTIRHRDGRLLHVLYNASVYKDVRGNVLGVFAAARDVTAQQKAEAEVADQRQKELERLAELERFQQLTVGRELKMIELKREIEELKKLIPPASNMP